MNNTLKIFGSRAAMEDWLTHAIFPAEAKFTKMPMEVRVEVPGRYLARFAVASSEDRLQHLVCGMIFDSIELHTDSLRAVLRTRQAFEQLAMTLRASGRAR